MMVEERDIAAFTFPFAAATAAAVYFSGIYARAVTALASASFIFAAAFLAILVHIASSGTSISRTGDIPGTGVRNPLFLIIATAIFCGLSCGFSGHLLSISDCEGSLMSFAGRLGQRMQDATDAMAFRNPRTNALVKALLTGNRSSLSPDTVQIFRSSGASHILALSGLHLGIIYGIVKKLLSLAGGSRISRMAGSVLSIIICGFYTLSTGAGDSITRAFIFIALGESAAMFHRTRKLSRILMAGLLVHLTLFPTAVTSIGFQLSYAAMAGIAWIYPPLRDIWTISPEDEKSGAGIMYKIWSMAALSIACQASAGVLAWFHFGTFPQYFLLTNLLAAPIAGLLIPAALLCLTCSTIFGSCPQIFLSITEFLSDSMTFILNVISGI